MCIIKIITTNKQEKKYWESQTVSTIEHKHKENQLIIYPSKVKQAIEGFGGIFTEENVHSYSKLSETEKLKFMRRYFSEDGLAYNMVRIHTDLCDDEGILPMIKAAQKVAWNDICFIVSARGLATFMNVSDDTVSGSRGNEIHYRTWAHCFVKLIYEYEGMGLPITHIISPKALEENNFINEYLKPILEKSGNYYTKIITKDAIRGLPENREEQNELKQAEQYIRDIITHLKSGICVINDWNFELDEDHLAYYYIGHLTKYVQRAASVIEVTQEIEGLEVIGFLNPTGERVIMMMNETDYQVEGILKEENLVIAYALEARSIQTFIYKNE